jgi:hypothetical protein
MQHLIGSVVPASARCDPLSHHRPNMADPALTKNPEAKAALQTLMSSLWSESEPVSILDITANRVGSHSTEASLKITGLLQAYGKRKVHQEVTLTAGSAKRYTFANAGSNLGDQLMESDAWKQQLQKLVDQDKGKNKFFYLVTGIFTCKDLEVKLENNRSRAAGAHATLPISQIAGNPDPATSSIVNPKVKIADEKTSQNKGSSKIGDEVVFAIAYHVLDLEFAPEPDHPGFWHKFGIGKKPQKKRKIIEAGFGKAVRADPGRAFDPYLDVGGADGAKASDGADKSSFELYTEEEPYVLAEDTDPVDEKRPDPEGNGHI